LDEQFKSIGGKMPSLDFKSLRLNATRTRIDAAVILAL